MKKITQKEKKEICKFRDMFPHEIAVSVHRSDDGGFCAEIVNFPGCLTQADTFSELIEMVNDCARTYFEVPEKYLCYMPNYLPPVSVAQKFNVFPFTRLNEVLNLTTGNARVKC